MNPIVIEWLAFAVGTVGTVAWATGFKFRDRPIEGWFWLISALLWIWFAYMNNHKGLASRDMIDVALYVIGLVKVYKTFKQAQEQKISNTPPHRTGEVFNPECPNCDGLFTGALDGPGSRALAMRTSCEVHRTARHTDICLYAREPAATRISNPRKTVRTP